jgi:rod shape-determining protein MreC
MDAIFTKKRLIILFVLLACFYFLSFFNNGIKNFFYSQSEKLQASLWQKGSEESFSLKNQEQLNKKLIEENQKLLSQLGDLETIQGENEFLREALGLELNKNFELILGRVMGKDIAKDYILLNIGERDGVKQGFPVVLSNKILLGKIVDVYPDYSRVMLITDKKSKIDVEIPDSKGFALVKGDSGFKMSLDMFPKDKELNEESLILTSALGGNYPEGMVVGKVKNVKNFDNEAFKKSEIELVFDFNQINNVFVIKNAEIYND